MKCTNCGFEREEDFRFCPRCGSEAQTVTPAVSNPAATRVFSVLKDNMFLAICILMTVSCFFSLLCAGISVINILATVFLWLAYAQSRKGIVDSRHLRRVSGCIYAEYVVVTVLSIIVIVCGVVIIALFSALSLGYSAVASGDISELIPWLSDVPVFIFNVIVWVIGIALIVGGVAALVVNLIGMRKIHRFVKSVYLGVTDPTVQVTAPRTVKNWMIVYAVTYGISALSSMSIFPAALGSGCCAAVLILAAILVNKYFIEQR